MTWMEFEFDSSSDTGSAITIPEDENFFSDCNQYFLLEDGTVILLPDRIFSFFPDVNTHLKFPVERVVL